MRSTAYILSVCTGLLMSCSANKNFKKDKSLFKSSAVLTKYKSIGDMNDAFFVIRENNFFEFYMQLFDSVKNSDYPGRYAKKGDTLLLNFYNKKGKEILGNKALINPAKKEIIFFDTYTGVKKTLTFN